MGNNIIKQGAYKPYISGLKGAACLMVMVGHYIGLYKYAENFPVESIVLNYFDKFLDSKLGFVLDESYWVILFFVVSGYLVANSCIFNLKEVFIKSAIRFLRLGVPVLFAYTIIFVLYKFVGFHTNQTLGLMENSFVQNAFSGTYGIIHVLKSPVDVLILGKTSLNSPYWVLRDMFLASILIYLLLWFKHKIKSDNAFLIVFFCGFLVSLFKFEVVYAVLFGMMVALLEKEENQVFFKNKIFVFTLLVLCAMMRAVPRQRLSCVFFAMLILMLPKLPLLNKLFSSRLADFINKISFGIYSFHWPVLCSIGMLVLIKIYPAIGLLKACVVTAAVCIAITFLISIIYYYCIEKFIYVGLKKIEKGRKK